MNASKNKKSQSLHRFNPVRHDVSKLPTWVVLTEDPRGIEQ